ncbi:MAG: transposase [Proteobacteria bacterium]|nr:transposase [Pseudomonadota bacterium]
MPEYKYLLSIPGFGPVVSATVLAAIGDPFRFESLSRRLDGRESGFKDSRLGLKRQ